MKWNGKHLATIGEMSDVIVAIARENDQEAADEFMLMYRAENESADANVGYLTGYYGHDMMEKVQKMFHVAHPIFGTRMDVTPEEAFAAGRERAEASMRGELGKLLPAEKMALTVALAQVNRGDEVPPNTTAVLVFALDRIVKESD